jgi:hypothetical protein
MNFHQDSVDTVRTGSLCCPARRPTRSFRPSPTENRSRHPSRDPFRSGYHDLSLRTLALLYSVTVYSRAKRWRLRFVVGLNQLLRAILSDCQTLRPSWTVAATANRQLPTANR